MGPLPHRSPHGDHADHRAGRRQPDHQDHRPRGVADRQRRLPGQGLAAMKAIADGRVCRRFSFGNVAERSLPKGWGCEGAKKSETRPPQGQAAGGAGIRAARPGRLTTWRELIASLIPGGWSNQLHLAPPGITQSYLDLPDKTTVRPPEIAEFSRVLPHYYPEMPFCRKPLRRSVLRLNQWPRARAGCPFSGFHVLGR